MASYLDKIVAKYSETDNNSLYVKLDNKLTKDNVYLSNLLVKLKKDFISVTKNIILIKTNSAEQYTEYQELINFDENNKSTSRNHIKHFSLMKPYITSINNMKYTINIDKNENIPKFNFKNNDGNVKIIYTFNYITNDLPTDWIIQVKFIKVIKTNDINLITWYKDNIFKNYNIENISSILLKQNSNLIDFIDINIKYTGEPSQINTNLNKIENVMANVFIDESFVDKSQYHKYIYDIAKYIITDKFALNNFKYKYGLKQLSNNVIDLNKNIYFNDMINKMQNYYLTDKIDGQRCMIIVSEYYNNEVDIKIIADKVYLINSFIINNESNTKSVTIYDAEMLYTGNLSKELQVNKLHLYLFDIIVVENKNISNLPFEKRLDYLKQNEYKILNKDIGSMKTFVELTTNFKNEIKEFYNKKKSYEIDGLIFTPSSRISTLKLHNKSIHINSNYKNMMVYKWKPIELLTIDFYIKQKKNSDYILFSGVSSKDFDKYRMSYIDNYKQIIPTNFHNRDFFPIQFMPSDDPLAYQFTYNESNKIDGKVGEFSYINNKWKLLRLRNDRDEDIERGDYFGNYFKVAESIWNNIKNPLTLEDITSDKIIRTNYFKVDNNDIYKAQRNYNSFVKSNLLSTIENKNWIIDLASGKGQDLPRISKMGFKNALFIDSDESALFELIERKHSINTNGMKILTKKLDLKSSFDDIMKALSIFKLPEVDVIICNFALHYFTNSYDTINNLIKAISVLLKPNGLFMYTTFDGETIFNKLGNNDVYDLVENDKIKYSIKKNYISTSLTDLNQEIGVLLPFSNNEYYNEYLVNNNYLKNIFKDNNLEVIKSASFDTMFEQYKKINNDGYTSLTDIDKEYISLYHYNIVKKVKPIIGKNNKYSNNILIVATILETVDINDVKQKNKMINKYIKNISTHFGKLGYTNSLTEKSNNMYTIKIIDTIDTQPNNLKKLYDIAVSKTEELPNYTTVVYQNINYIPTFDNFQYYTYLPDTTIVLPYKHSEDMLSNSVIIANTINYPDLSNLQADETYNIIFSEQLPNIINKFTNENVNYIIDTTEKKNKYIKLTIKI